MTSGERLEALRAALGTDAVREHEPVEVDGVEVRATLRPADGEALGAALRRLAELGAAAIVRGGGSRLGLGNPPRAADVLLSTEALGEIDELDADEGVVHAGAGTPLAELRKAVNAAGWTLPLDPPGAHATLGGALAAAASGPRQLGFGRPRDLVLGLEVALGDGTRTRCGGRVVKNVTGYDLAKLHAGALGSLGVIEAVWLRLRPTPQCRALLAAAAGGRETALASGLAAARLASACAAALVDAPLAPAVDPGAAPSEGALLLVELAGDESVVTHERRRLAEMCGAREVHLDALERLRGLLGGRFGDLGLRFRIAARPTTLAAAMAPLAEAGAALVVQPGLGLVAARFPLGPEAGEAEVAAAWRAVRRAARASGGSARLEEGPVSAKTGRDVFGDPPDGFPLMQALKRRFDPAGVLNPGRFVGRL